MATAPTIVEELLAKAASASHEFPGDGDVQRSVVSRLAEAGQLRPDDVAFVWLDDRGQEVAHLTFGELWHRSGVLADHLVSPAVGLRPGSGALIVFPFGLEFLPALLACMRAGVIALSVYPPNPAKLALDLPKLAVFAEVGGARVALTTQSFKRFIRVSELAGHEWPASIVTWVATDAVDGLTPLCKPAVPTTQFTSWDATMRPLPPTRRLIAPDKLQRPSPAPSLSVAADQPVQPEATALVQFTSGSSGDPRGVLVSHRALAYAVAMSGRAGRASNPSCAMLVWVPQYHDLGLIGTYLTCPCFSMPVYGMSPLSFLQNPLLWIDSLVRLHITATSAPNFGWGLAIKRAQARGTPIDLRHVEVAVIGAEPITQEVEQGMQDVLHIPRASINAGFCCAEMVLVITAQDHGFDEDTGIAACGEVAWAQRVGSNVIVVDPSSHEELPDSVHGEIWAQSPSAASGYLGHPAESAARFQCVVRGPNRPGFWYNTKDMGYIKHGHLYVLGRASDLIIVNGRNIYPNDIEYSVHRLAGDMLRAGSTVAIQTAADSVTILAELRQADIVYETAALQVLATSVEAAHDVRVQGIAVFLKATLPKTTSGKVRRQETLRRWLAGSLSPQFSYSAPTASGQVLSWDELLVTYGVTDPNKTLGANGVDSLRLVRFIDEIRERYGVIIDALDASTKPVALLRVPDDSSTVPLPPRPDAEAVYIGRTIPEGFLRGLLQTIGVLFVLLVLTACAIPAAAVYRRIPDWVATNHADPWVRTFDTGPGLFSILVPLVWMAVYTIAVVVLKWLLIGRYQPCCLAMWSLPFFRWWLVDRLFDVWGLVVGMHLLDTPYLNLVYKCLGANVAWNCRIQTLIREHDLFAAGPCCTVSGVVNTRLMTSQGVWFDHASVAGHEKLPAHAVTFPGQSTAAVTETSTYAYDSCWVQRSLVPFAVIAAFGVGVYVCSAALQQVGVASSSLQLFACFVGSALVVMAQAVVLTRLQVLPVLVDRVAQTAANSLRPWLDFSIVLTWCMRAFGASLAPGVMLNKFANIAPSEAKRVRIGMGSLISRCSVQPGFGTVRLGARVSVGIGTVITTNCHLQDQSATFPMSVLPAGTTVPRATLFMGTPGSYLPSSSVAARHTWWSYVCWEATSFLVRAIIGWAPLLLIEEAVRRIMDELVTDLIHGPLPGWAAVWIASTVFALLGATSVTLLMIASQWTLYPAVPAVVGTTREVDSVSLQAACFTVCLSFTEIVTVWIRPFISGSMLHNALYKLCGAHIPGWTNAVLMDSFIMDPRLTVMGKNVICDRMASVNGHVATAATLRFGRVQLSDGCLLQPCAFVRAAETLAPNTTLAAASVFLGPSSSHRNATTAATFVGAPARRCVSAPSPTQTAALSSSLAASLLLLAESS